jgi:hypothetical protein
MPELMYVMGTHQYSWKVVIIMNFTAQGFHLILKKWNSETAKCLTLEVTLYR